MPGHTAAIILGKWGVVLACSHYERTGASIAPLPKRRYLEIASSRRANHVRGRRAVLGSASD
jgi:hypothetical protein